MVYLTPFDFCPAMATLTCQQAEQSVHHPFCNQRPALAAHRLPSNLAADRLIRVRTWPAREDVFRPGQEDVRQLVQRDQAGEQPEPQAQRHDSRPSQSICAALTSWAMFAAPFMAAFAPRRRASIDRKSTRLNSSH